MRRPAKPSWFAKLRHDARLFAALAFLLLSAHALQPPADANANADGHGVLCTALGVQPLPDGTPSDHDACGDCVVGAQGLKSPDKAIAAAVAAWDPVSATKGSRWPASEGFGLDMSEPERPHGIRAPPVIA